MVLFLLPIVGNAQVPIGERAPDIRYPVSGQVKIAQRIVSDCLRHGRWYEDFSPEAHKAIPKIIASMKHQEPVYLECHCIF